MDSLFVTKFDVYKGYTLIHTSLDASSGNAETVRDLEFRSLPAGLHETRHSVIRFQQPVPGTKSLEGIAIFRQNGMNAGVTPGDRSQLRMYSVGLLARHLDSSCAAFLDTLDAQLQQFVDGNGNEAEFVAGLDKAFTAFQQESRDSGVLVYHEADFEYLFTKFGPQFVTLWQMALTQKRVLLSNKHFGVGASCLLLSVLEKAMDDIGVHTRFLHNVVLQDLGTLGELTSAKNGYFACTSEDLLTYKTKLFDYVVTFHPETKKPVVTCTADGSIVRYSYEHSQIFGQFVPGWPATRSWFDLFNYWIYRSSSMQEYLDSFGMVDTDCLLALGNDDSKSSSINAFPINDTASVRSRDKSGKKLKKSETFVDNLLETLQKLFKMYLAVAQDTIANYESDTMLQQHHMVPLEVTYSDVNEFYLNPFIPFHKQFVVDLFAVFFTKSCVVRPGFQARCGC